ncbi:type II toxin-antitoxin system RelE family toxin [Campylobacter troglodytis]|uniref:type II toxin-antitoxin system RelE family toxin n=1 Tax=Campylobacter troglodytis TaxID=654363 RepID=UPI0011598C61|nr:type II toxin-antitoxin system RelE/ParE family toxin [Campylobacter troglodytis]TQR61564.1 plasmid stabilization protein [Campylobacter troglodytis]
MTYKIIYSKDFEKFLDKHRDLRARILSSFEQIAKNPYQNDLDISKLKGEASKYRLRLGKYRFLYEIIETQILIYAYKADSRGAVYK